MLVMFIRICPLTCFELPKYFIFYTKLHTFVLMLYSSANLGSWMDIEIAFRFSACFSHHQSFRMSPLLYPCCRTRRFVWKSEPINNVDVYSCFFFFLRRCNGMRRDADAFSKASWIKMSRGVKKIRFCGLLFVVVSMCAKLYGTRSCFAGLDRIKETTYVQNTTAYNQIQRDKCFQLRVV